MKLEDIYANINTQMSKDGNDGFVSLIKWNKLLPSVLYELIREECMKNSVQLVSGNEKLLSIKILKDLIATTQETMISTGIYIEDYLYWGVGYVQGHDYNEARRKVKLVDISEYNDMLTNMMNIGIDERPIAFEYYYSGATYIKAYPSDIGVLELYYIRKPDDPFLDYYIDDDGETTFLDENEDYNLGATDQYRDGTYDKTGTSLTKELQIPVDYHPKFQDMMMERLSLPINDQYKNQYSMAKEKQA